MKIKITGYESGRVFVLTSPCPYNKIWLEDRMAGSIACAECEYFLGHPVVMCSVAVEINGQSERY